MADVSLDSSTLGTSLQEILTCAEIEPGQEPSYQTCKTIYLAHTLGAKMAEAPISMAQSQQREISVQSGPEETVKEAFLEEWENIGADDHIHNVMKTSRIYGVASIALLSEATPMTRPVDYRGLWNASIAFNVLDPLNTAGSLVLNQTPTALDFQKQRGITISGQPIHRSRTVTMLNEKPIYLGYTNSAFGYVGRSVYQRALYPLKSFIQTQITNDMVARKAGIIVYKAKPAGSIVENMMLTMLGIKLQQVRAAMTNNVLGINAPDEEIAAIDLTNVNTAMEASRTFIIKDIATSSDMPSKILLEETLAEGFGEGVEDAKYIAHWIDRIRVSMRPLYAYFDQIVQHRAWNPEFYKTIQHRYPEEYGGKGYTQAFYEWTNSFKATWPSLLIEPESEKVETDDVRFRAILSTVEILLSNLKDPENIAIVIQWMADNMNENKFMFTSPLELNYEAIEATAKDTQDQQAESHEAEMRPETLSDSVTKVRRAVRDIEAITRRIGHDAVRQDRHNRKTELVRVS